MRTRDFNFGTDQGLDRGVGWTFVMRGYAWEEVVFFGCAAVVFAAVVV